MKVHNAMIGAVVALALAAGCKKNPVETGDVTTTSATTETNRNDAVLGSDDAAFLQKANEGGLLEVKLGAAAAQRAQASDVKMLGNRIASDHGRINAELQDIALQKGVVLPTQLADADLKKVASFDLLTGRGYDKAYADETIAEHAADIDAFEKASKDLKDPELRAWAAKTLSTLESHLQLAKDAKAKVH